MCMRATEEGCVLADQQKALEAKVADMGSRLTQVETDIGKIRAESRDGFKQGAESMREINASVSNLAHDFAQRFNNIETTVVAEKAKWGETLRWIVKVSVKVLLAGVLVAMGINAIDKFFSGLSRGDVPCEKVER